MSDIETGGPAFPTDCNKNIIYGMSLLDYFAAKAMQGMLVNQYQSGIGANLQMLAQDAYEVANAMMEARK